MSQLEWTFDSRPTLATANIPSHEHPVEWASRDGSPVRQHQPPSPCSWGFFSRKSLHTQSASSAPVFPDGDEDPNEELFIKLRSHLERGIDVGEQFTFVFKKRQTQGRAIHVAALHPDGSALIPTLLGAGARVDEECHSEAKDPKRTYTLQPIHLAAGRGNELALQALLEAGADVHAYSTFDHKPHYTALHEAAYFRQISCIRVLLESRADANLTNTNMQTPLHIAAAMGCPSCASVMVKMKADLRLKDSKGSTPLITAIGSRYPDKELHVLARPCIDDLLEVAQEAPAAAAVLLLDTDRWRRGLMDTSQGYRHPCAKDLVTLLLIAPKVAALLVDILTVKPRVHDSFHNPLPRHARHDTFRFRLCEYTGETTWGNKDEVLDKGIGDRLRELLVQVKSDRAQKGDGEEDVSFESRIGRLHIRMLLLPNVVSYELLNALSQLSTQEELLVFQRSAIQAVLDFTWCQLVRLEYTVSHAIRVMELAILVWVTFAPPETEDGKRLSWSLLTATATRSAFTEVAQVMGCHWYLRNVRSYFENRWNYIDMVTIGVYVLLTWGAVHSRMFDNRELLALVSFFRWIQLLYNTGAYRFAKIGNRIVPIFQSFFKVGGIATIMLFTFLAFFHAFAALENADSIEPAVVFLNAFRLLLLADGDGVNYILELGGRSTDGNFWTQCFFYLGALIFCICILNLFIAVHGGAYETESARVTENFYRNRASICVSTLLLPRWRYKLPLMPIPCWLIWMLVTIPMWVGLLYAPVDPVVSTIFLALSLVIGDMLLRKTPWEESQGKRLGYMSREEETVKILQPTPPKVAPEEIPEPQDAQMRPTASLDRLQSPRDTKVQETPPLPPDELERLETQAKLTVRMMLVKANRPPVLLNEMFLWWCSWADEEETQAERKRESAALLQEGLSHLNSKVSNLGRSLTGQDGHFGDLACRVDSLGRRVTRGCTLLEESFGGSLSRFESRLDGACRQFVGVDGRIHGLEAQVAELQRGISQLANHLQSLTPTESQPHPAGATILQTHKRVMAPGEAIPHIPAALCGQSAVASAARVVRSTTRRPADITFALDSEGGGRAGTPGWAVSPQHTHDNARWNASPQHRLAGVPMTSLQQGGDAGGGGSETVRSGDAGGGGCSRRGRYGSQLSTRTLGPEDSCRASSRAILEETLSFGGIEAMSDDELRAQAPDASELPLSWGA